MVLGKGLKMSIPNKKECYELLKEFNVPKHIVEHSEKVRDAAMYLAKKLKEKGEKVDLTLVEASSLLHDIAKIICLNSDVLHGHKGEQILKEKGFPEAGEVVGKHGLGAILEKGCLSSWEDKLVYYADKRVNHEKMVSLRERFDYLIERYGGKKKLRKVILDSKPLNFELEKELLEKAGLKELGELK